MTLPPGAGQRPSPAPPRRPAGWPGRRGRRCRRLTSLARLGARRPRSWLVALPLVALVAGCATSGASGPPPEGLPDRLRVGLIPNVAPDEQRARYQPFGDHLEEALGVEVELFVASDYAGVVTALAAGQLDVAYLGGLTYLQALRQTDLEVLVTEVDIDTATTGYHSAIVVPAASPHRSVADLLEARATLALGDVASTSGSLYPRVMLADAGARCSPVRVNECPPLARVTFTGGHDAAAQAVLSGRTDAAGLELRILRRLERDGIVPAGALRVVERRLVEGYPWVARAALGAEAHARVTAAFLAIDDPALLDLLRARAYVETDHGAYAEMERAALELGLLEER